MMKTKAVFYSDNKELYHSFKRALNALAGIVLINNLVKNAITVFVVEDNKDFGKWLWGYFRSKKRALNPLIVIGTEDKSLFIAQNPVFITYSNEYAYFQIPFDLRELIAAIKRLKPIHDHITRKLIISEFSKGYEYTLITHDLKIIKGDREATINNLLKVRDFYRAKEGVNIVEIIDKKIKEIQIKEDNWEEVARDIQRFLEERLTRR